MVVWEVTLFLTKGIIKVFAFIHNYSTFVGETEESIVVIEDLVKIHDQFSIEFKLGFTADKKRESNEFSYNMWVFVPNSLDINSYTYSKKNFYRDVKSNIRLITPVYILRDIANENKLPFHLLRESFQKVASNPTRTNIAEYENHIKMFHSILKSSLRDEINFIRVCKSSADKHFLLSEFMKNCRQVIENYRSLRPVIHVPTIEQNVFQYYMFGDEFMSNLMEMHCFKLVQYILVKNETEFFPEKNELLDFIDSEIRYKGENGYILIDKESKNQNRDVVSRFNTLKKYMESQLFLDVKQKEDGTFTKQIYYSLAAGISMIFATVVAFSFQQKYGNFTIPLFVALVVSYMLKDRIKELVRYYFSYKLNNRYFDTKTDISINESSIGWYKESQVFVKEHQVPQEAVKLRNRSAILEAENRINDEKIIFYRMKMCLSSKNIKTSNIYPVTGVNNILRFNLSQYIRKMDDSKVPLFITDEVTDYKIIEGGKVYYLNFILRLQYQDQLEFKRYRVMFNREGIKRLEKF